MSKYIVKNAYFNLPSGLSVHPCRLIFKDGTLMWKHAMLNHNCFTSLPLKHSHEAHIVKTAQRIEELNTWVSQGLEPWDCLTPCHWYDPLDPELSTGISLYFTHNSKSNNDVYLELSNQIKDHELLEMRGSLMFFKRC